MSVSGITYFTLTLHDVHSTMYVLTYMSYIPKYVCIYY